MNSYPSDPIQMRRASRLRALFLVFCAFVLGGLILPNLQVRWREPDSHAEGTGLPVSPGAPKSLSEGELYAHAAQIASPAVVFIDTKQRADLSPGEEMYYGGPQYNQMSGSGVIIDSSGDILTNAHVVGSVNQADRTIKVTLPDGRGFPGKVIGSDQITDVALVHIEGANLPVAKMGTVRSLVPGQMAIAIGNPFRYRYTVTHGVVSALGRPFQMPDGRVYENLIQTDCAINPGNSGGALVDMQGEVIGINTLIDNRGAGLGFAIPIDTALRVADQLKRFGHIKRPWLGIFPVTNELRFADELNLPSVQGVVVWFLAPDGPAAKAGLQRFDVITKINGQPVPDQETFKAIEKKLRIGEKVEVVVQRADGTGHGSIVVGEMP